MKIPTQLIEIEWDGPFKTEDVKALTSESDYGVYQIYGAHVVYGSDVLLYIGKAVQQHFGTRVPQHAGWIDDNHDAGRIRIYVGRLAGEATPSDTVWGRHIDLAERLLLFCHSPALNVQKNLGSLDADLQDVHVLNWGHRANLLPEVSGVRWTNKLGSRPTFREFDSNDDRDVPHPAK